jgi:hypothetical protein
MVTNKDIRILPWGVASVIFLLGYAIGQWHSQPHLAVADERPVVPRQAFLSGSERSELVLREMQKTLEQMDGRLANIERAAVTISKQGVR